MTPQESIQPVGVDMAAVQAYIGLLFAHADWTDGSIISLLGVGEKGTANEGKLRERKFIDPRSAFAMASVQGHLERWAVHSGGAFIAPAIVRPEAEAEGDVRLDKVSALTAIILDIDSGDTAAKRAHAESYLGPATFIVDSGGVTEAGTPKQHLYWRLSEVEEDVEHVAMLRKMLAARCGGDQSFGRATQVVRIPGSIHGKNNHRRPVTLHSVRAELDYHLSDLAEAIEAMPHMEGCEPVSNVVQLPLLANGMMDFSGAAGRDSGSLQTALTQTITEGGDADRNRWTEFSKVAGFQINLVRNGRADLEAAFAHVEGWVLGQMVPPWPRERIVTEWHALLNLDVKRNGPFIGVPVPGSGLNLAVPGTRIEAIEGTSDLLSWSVSRRSSAEPAARKVLIDSLIFKGKRHMFVAEGGAGKTMLLMDLALKLAAAGTDGPELFWMGQKVLPDAFGGHVIIMTGEDDLEELDIRWKSLDPDWSLRRRAGDRLIAIPLDSLGGAFPLVGYHPHNRTPVASEKWAKLYGAMKGIDNGEGFISAVIVDTLNSTMHGDENSAAIVGEYIAAIAPITADLQAAFIVSHHVRKQGNEPVKDADDMKAAIRGSTAIMNGMRVVIGFWHDHEWQRKMRQLGHPPMRNRLYCAAVVKANVPAYTGTKNLLRDETGVLRDVTFAVAAAKGADVERRAWVAFSVGWYADQQFYFTATGTDSPYRHREKLAPCLRDVGRDPMTEMVKALIDGGKLIQRTVQNHGSKAHWLDLSAKKKVKRVRGEMGRVPIEPDWTQYYFDPANGGAIRPLAQPKGE